MRQVPLLDSREEVSKIDVENVLQSIEMLGDQVQHIWELAKKIQLDDSYTNVKNVVVAGMGGSSLGTHIIQTVYRNELKVPVIIAPDYDVPNFVNADTLVIASSYSGTTEETLAAVADAKQKGAKIVGITSGGKLAEFLRSNNYPALIFEPTYNPCKSPRMALGYSVFGQIALFSQAGLLQVGEGEYKAVLEAIAQAHLKSSINIEQTKNIAKLAAFHFVDRVPVITAAQHLEGVTHVFANLLNESAKTYSEYRVIPEINHHLTEGLEFPASNRGNLFFLMIDSPLYTASNRKRLTLTQQVIEQNHIDVQTMALESADRLAQAFELLVFASYTSFYLAILHNKNPRPNPWVDWFKAELKK